MLREIRTILLTNSLFYVWKSQIFPQQLKKKINENYNYKIEPTELKLQ